MFRAGGTLQGSTLSPLPAHYRDRNVKTLVEKVALAELSFECFGMDDFVEKLHPIPEHCRVCRMFEVGCVNRSGFRDLIACYREF